MTTGGRLHWLTPDELDEDQRSLYDHILDSPRAKNRLSALTDEQGRLNGPFNAMLHNPVMGEVLNQLGTAVRFGNFSPRTTETAILEIARLRRSEYEWFAHEQTARQAGFSDAEIDAIRSGTDVPGASTEEALVRSVTRALVIDGDLDDGLYARAVEGLGETGVVALVNLVGYYQMLATSLRVFRVPLPPGAATSFDD